MTDMSPPNSPQSRDAASRYELWQITEGEDATLYRWMVWDVEGMEPHWFTDLTAARDFLVMRRKDSRVHAA